MAKIYSSIREEAVEQMEKEIKPVFIAWIGECTDRTKRLHAFINLERKVSLLKHKARAAIDSDLEDKYLRELDNLQPKFNSEVEYIGWPTYKAVIIFNNIVGTYGLHKLYNKIQFGFWLRCSMTRNQYYDLR